MASRTNTNYEVQYSLLMSLHINTFHNPLRNLCWLYNYLLKTMLQWRQIFGKNAISGLYFSLLHRENVFMAWGCILDNNCTCLVWLLYQHMCHSVPIMLFVFFAYFWNLSLANTVNLVKSAEGEIISLMDIIMVFLFWKSRLRVCLSTEIKHYKIWIELWMRVSSNDMVTWQSFHHIWGCNILTDGLKTIDPESIPNYWKCVRH